LIDEIKSKFYEKHMKKVSLNSTCGGGKKQNLVKFDIEIDRLLSQTGPSTYKF